MVQIVDNIVNVVGDSLEACLYSRYLAEQPHITRIDHYTTGEYGGFYFDQMRDDSYTALFLTNSQLQKIRKFIPDLEVKTISETYIKVPVKKMRFSSQYDDYITYPINKSSFEVEMDYVENILKKYTIEEFIEEYKTHKNITKLMKNIFSDHLYLNIVKKIGCNQWNTNQSQLDPERLYNLLHLYQLDSNKTFEYYYPINGVYNLCAELLANPKIVIHKETRKATKEIVKRQVNKITYLAEYVDYYMDFMFGGFDYVKGHTEIHSRSISDYRYFRVFTPFDKKHYVYFGVDEITYKSWNESAIITSNDFGRLMFAPTQANMRRLIDYRKVSNVSKNFKIIA